MREQIGKKKKKNREQRDERSAEEILKKKEEKKREFLRFEVDCTRQEKKKGNREEGRISVSSLTSGKIRTY